MFQDDSFGGSVWNGLGCWSGQGALREIFQETVDEHPDWVTDGGGDQRKG